VIEPIVENIDQEVSSRTTAPARVQPALTPSLVRYANLFNAHAPEPRRLLVGGDLGVGDGAWIARGCSPPVSGWPAAMTI